MLLVGHYEEPDPARGAEYAECLRRNCEIPCIEQVQRFIETSTWQQVDHPKVHNVHHGHRAKFEELFAYSNRELGGHICIIANSDIFFDDTLSQLTEYDFTNQLLAISRWNLATNGETLLAKGSEGTQDVWIFRAPIVWFPANWHFGVMACDGRIVHEARKAGLEVRNPCLSIKATHLHLSAVHTYDVNIVVPGPSGFVKADTLYPHSESPKPKLAYDPHFPIPELVLQAMRKPR